MAESELMVSLIARRLRQSSSDESDSTSDEEWAEWARQARKRRKRKILRPRIEDYAERVVSRYMENEFKNHFRLSRATFDFLLSVIGKDLMRQGVKGCEAIPSSQQLMIALWKMGTPDSYRSICDRFNVGKATALRAVRRVTAALFKKAPKFIHWPSGDKVVAVMRGFEEASGFINTIGAIDGTHVTIDAPTENAADYVNRKGVHSIQLQVVCDHRRVITHCFAGYPGSVHDQRVFRVSEVAEFLNDRNKFPADSHIIGDAAYGLHPRLLVPFKDNGHLTARQRNYNFLLSSARMVIERCFALLKGRWRSLLHCLPMKRVDLMAQYIVACCVLHNICLLRGDDFLAVIVGQGQNEVNIAPPMNEGARNGQEGRQKRNLIMDTLPVRNV